MPILSRRIADVGWRLLSLVAATMTAPAAASAVPAPATLFANVNVVPMDRERVLPGRSVLVEDGRIVEIADQIVPPPGARTIDGHGTAWLLPGLADMHVHADSREELSVMLVAGITTALHMGEASNSFVGRTRAAVEAGEVPGPRVLAALAVDGSPRFGHLVVPTTDAAGWAVRLARANGYDFIKVYTGLAPEIFAALVAEGRAAGLPVVGHSVESVGLETQVAAGQVMIAHLEEFFAGFFRRPDGADPLDPPDDSEIARAVAFARQSGVTVTADLTTFQAIAGQWGRPEVVALHLRAAETRRLAPEHRVAWYGSGYQRRTGSLAGRAAFLARFVKALSDAKVPLIAGTDAPTIAGLVPGDALHRNLAELTQAGLSPFEALSTATREPGRFVSRAIAASVPFGTVTEGARADLLLTVANPLEDLSVLRHPLGVMANGRWYSEADLCGLVVQVERRYSAAALPIGSREGGPERAHATELDTCGDAVGPAP